MTIHTFFLNIIQLNKYIMNLQLQKTGNMNK